MDMRKLSQRELEKLIADAEKALERLKNRDMKAARAAAEKAAAKFGFSLNELSDAPTTRAKAARPKPKAKAKTKSTKGKAAYRNPDNSAETWTGRGRRPNWVIALDDKGVDRASYAI